MMMIKSNHNNNNNNKISTTTNNNKQGTKSATILWGIKLGSTPDRNVYHCYPPETNKYKPLLLLLIIIIINFVRCYDECESGGCLMALQIMMVVLTITTTTTIVCRGLKLRNTNVRLIMLLVPCILLGRILWVTGNKVFQTDAAGINKTKTRWRFCIASINSMPALLPYISMLICLKKDQFELVDVSIS